MHGLRSVTRILARCSSQEAILDWRQDQGFRKILEFCILYLPNFISEIRTDVNYLFFFFFQIRDQT